MEFSSFSGLAEFLAKQVAAMPAAKHEALEISARLVEKTAKAKLGHYQAGWPRLQPETIARKATGDSPLLEEGGLRDSIQHRVEGDSAAEIGSDLELAIWQEMGTSRGIPPRPFMGPAGAEKAEAVTEIIGAAVVGVLGGGMSHMTEALKEAAD
ncbi:MAG TPA: hypothetical protein VGP42_02155 [Stellaceae bacterium]|jgi:phage gpG-like protein|nr:hypothetical protein [Stellaceae bacterium]